jgi:hypothetical protein
LCSGKGVGRQYGAGSQLTKTNYLPRNPPTLGDDDENCVMVLVGRHICLHYAALWWYLDEDAMVWRDFDSILETDN